MFCPPEITTRHKTIVGALIGLALIGGILLILLRYFEVFSDLGQVANKNPLQQQAVDLARLGENYRIESAKILADFLAATDNQTADIATLADRAQKDLLALSLPAPDQKHFSEVILLGEIRDLAQAGQREETASKISELKQTADQ